MNTGIKKLTSPPYKGTQGHWLTRQLFADVDYPAREDGRKQYAPVFSLYGLISGFIDCRSTFVELRDPTGYQWAMKYLGSYEHWSVLSQTNWFKPELEKWIEEIETIFTAEAIQKVREIASGDSAQSLPAAKYMAERGWEKTRGRPSKSEMNKELKKHVERITEHDEDAKRIGLKVITGGR